MGIKFFGQFLLERRIITTDHLIEAVKYQKSHNLRFGEYAVAKGYLTREDVEKIVEEQKRTDLRFGELAVQMNLLTAAQVEELLTLQENDHILIGEALVEKGFVTREVIDRELGLFREDQGRYLPGEIPLPEYDDIENPLLIRDFVDLTQKMLLREANLKTKIDSSGIRTSEPGYNDVTIGIRLSGATTVEYVFSTSLPVSTLITSGIIGQSAEGEPREVIIDGVKEFCNIICGNIIVKMAQRGKAVDISPPRELIYASDGYHIVRGRKAISFCLRSPEGDILLILIQSAA